MARSLRHSGDMRDAFRRGWQGGGSETACGAGSTARATSGLRRLLPAVFRAFGIETLNDAGCGDANWMQYVDLSGIGYLGYDVVRRECWGPLGERKSMRFEVADFVADPGRPCDLTLCRDALIHLPNRLVIEALARFRQSSKYLLATTFPGAPNHAREIVPGGFARLDMATDPFRLGEPLLSISERSRNKYLAMWAL